MKTDRRQAIAAFTAAAGSVLLPEPRARAAQSPSPETVGSREAVLGIGGVFFRAHDPKMLAQWYQDHLGVTKMPTKETDPVWEQQAGQTVFAPLPEKTGYFGDATKQWMLNFRVRDLDRMAAQLQAAGIDVKVDPEKYPNGRFARLHDPEGNPVELWQPADRSPSK